MRTVCFTVHTRPIMTVVLMRVLALHVEIHRILWQRMVGGVHGDPGYPGAAVVAGQDQYREQDDVITHLLPMVAVSALDLQLKQEQTEVFDSVVETTNPMGTCSTMVSQSVMMSGMIMMPRWFVK